MIYFNNYNSSTSHPISFQEGDFVLWLSEESSSSDEELPELKLWLSDEDEVYLENVQMPTSSKSNSREKYPELPTIVEQKEELTSEVQITMISERSNISKKRSRSLESESEKIPSKKQKFEGNSSDTKAPLIEIFIQENPESQTLSETPQSEELTSKSSDEEKEIVNVAIITDAVYLKHKTRKDDPERPERITSIQSTLVQAGLKTDANSFAPRAATEEEIGLCHERVYIDRLKSTIEKFKTSGKKETYNEAFRSIKQCRSPYVEGDFQLSPGTWDSAVYAVGAPLTALDAITDTAQKVTRAFCIVRPPGHHAHANTGSGFCVFNNVAIAAKYAIQNKNFKRVLIVDWDAHHGDGVQSLTEKDPNIFYFSIHKDTTSGGYFYPGPAWGHVDQIGKEEGTGTVMNWPIDPAKTNPREEVNKAFEALLSRMEEYKPELILISCGFDGHKDDSLVAGDPNEGLQLENEDYFSMTRKCVEIANKYGNGQIVSVLEGGYNLEAIARAAEAHVKGLMEA